MSHYESLTMPALRSALLCLFGCLVLGCGASNTPVRVEATPELEQEAVLEQERIHAEESAQRKN